MRQLEERLEHCQPCSEVSGCTRNAAVENHARRELLHALGIDETAQLQFVHAFSRRTAALQAVSELQSIEMEQTISVSSIRRDILSDTDREDSLKGPPILRLPLVNCLSSLRVQRASVGSVTTPSFTPKMVARKVQQVARPSRMCLLEARYHFCLTILRKRSKHPRRDIRRYFPPQ